MADPVTFKNETPKGMYPVNGSNDPKSTTPTGYMPLSRDADTLAPKERIDILTEINKALKPGQMEAFQQASKEFDEWKKANPKAANSELDKRIQTFREALEPVDAAIKTVMEKHHLNYQAFGGKDNPQPIIDYQVGPKGEHRAPENDPGFIEITRRDHNYNMRNQLIKNFETPPPAQQQNIQQGGPTMTPGGAAPQRQQGGPP